MATRSGVVPSMLWCSHCVRDSNVADTRNSNLSCCSTCGKILGEIIEKKVCDMKKKRKVKNIKTMKKKKGPRFVFRSSEYYANKFSEFSKMIKR